jgi:hypothetical protein
MKDFHAVAFFERKAQATEYKINLNCLEAAP